MHANANTLEQQPNPFNGIADVSNEKRITRHVLRNDITLRYQETMHSVGATHKRSISSILTSNDGLKCPDGVMGMILSWPS
jgi:hypothetical protein